jgi:hypothetical protein
MVRLGLAPNIDEARRIYDENKAADDGDGVDSDGNAVANYGHNAN